jgi:hypothetical protein
MKRSDWGVREIHRSSQPAGLNIRNKSLISGDGKKVMAHLHVLIEKKKKSSDNIINQPEHHKEESRNAECEQICKENGIEPEYPSSC